MVWVVLLFVRDPDVVCVVLHFVRDQDSGLCCVTFCTRSRLWFVLCYFLYDIQIVVCVVLLFVRDQDSGLCCVTFCISM